MANIKKNQANINIIKSPHIAKNCKTSYNLTGIEFKRKITILRIQDVSRRDIASNEIIIERVRVVHMQSDVGNLRLN
jgi:hypothetical protein